ncbi:MAG: hypothetical protein ACUVR0_11195 [Candidatus Aminicenantales bacterium]
MDPVLRLENQNLKFRASAFQPEVQISYFEWLLNGQKVGQTKHPFLFWNLKPGTYVLEVRAIAAEQILLSRPVMFKVLANYSTPAANSPETAAIKN